jgi:nucleoside-diphosphate-sugar epimerase
LILARVPLSRVGEHNDMKYAAIVTGAKGRLGSAFVRRLQRDEFHVDGVDIDDAHPAELLTRRPYLFDCAYRHGEPDRHVERVEGHLRQWQRYAAIFVPSSLWITEDNGYGRAKMAVERLAAQYNALGARVVTDRIGYFPGDGVVPDPTEPMFAHRVTGEVLYARVIARMLAPAAGRGAEMERGEESLEAVRTARSGRATESRTSI